MNNLLFYMPGYEYLAESVVNLPGVMFGRYEVINFPNGEFKIQMNSNVKNSRSIFLGTISPPYNQTFEALFTCHTLRKEGSESVIGVFPYLSFMRHEKDKPGEDQATGMIAKFIRDAGISRLLTFDIHSKHDIDFFDIPVTSISTSTIFANKIRDIGFDPDVVVAPDKGATERAKDVRIQLKNSNKLVVFTKVRSFDQSIVSTLFEGEMGERAVVIDDIIDTGQTLLNCVDILKEKGVKEIVIAVTHGVFSEEKWKNLSSFGVKKIFVSDSIPSVRNIKSDLIEVVSISPLLLEKLGDTM